MNNIAKVTEHKGFHKAVSFVIILCSIVLGLETILRDEAYKSFLNVIDIGITLFFVLEIFIRILAEKTPVHYFHLFNFKNGTSIDGLKNWMFSENGFWNWFDFLITIGSAIALVEHLFVHPEYLFITRLFRIFRIFRLLEISEKMREIEKKIAHIIPTVFSFGLLIFVMVYIYSIIGFYLFKGMNVGTADFSNLSQSMVTMFRVMTLDGWGDIMKATEAHATHLGHWVFLLFFVSFIGITAIVTLNIFIAVLASNVEIEMIGKRSSEPRKKESSVNHQNSQDLQWIKEDFTELKNEISALRQELETLKE